MKKVVLLVLLAVSFVISRLLLMLVNDPEGANLLVVTGLAVFIFMPLSLIYLFIVKKRKVKE